MRPCPKPRWRKLAVVTALSATITCGCAGATKSSIRPGNAPTETTSSTKSESVPEAISALETFLRRNDIDRPMRARAMFRLAALEEDAARARMDESGVLDLEPTIALYVQIIRDFPEFGYIPDIYYHLGHALVDSGHIEEGQHVFRVLVCPNHFTLNSSADVTARVTPTRLPQDHDAAFWKAWEARHPLPIDRAPLGALGQRGDETEFVSPYPQDCVPGPQTTGRRDAPRLIGEAWWRIGDYHFNNMGTFDGPYHLNRAAAAYRHAVRQGNALIRTLAMYKLAWTYFKQQRYEAAVAQFVELLRHMDTQPSRPGEHGVDFRKEASTYIAGALTYIDFAGPGPNDPFIPRDDVLDTEKNPRIVEQKMHVAIDRVRDAKIIPQNEAWTSDVHSALITEYHELRQLRNMVEASELFLARWPSDVRAVDIRKTMDQARAQLGSSSVP